VGQHQRAPAVGDDPRLDHQEREVHPDRGHRPAPGAPQLARLEQAARVDVAQPRRGHLDQGIDQCARRRTGAGWGVHQFDRRQQIARDVAAPDPDPAGQLGVAAPPPARGDQPEHDRGDREQHGDQPGERQDRERGRTAGRDHRAEQRQHQGDAGGCGHRVQPHPPGLVPVHERADTLQERRDRSARDSHDVALSRGGFEHSAPTSRCRGPDAFAAQVV